MDIDYTTMKQTNRKKERKGEMNKSEVVEFVIQILKKAAKLANEAEARCPDRFKVSPL
jgi:hypothetical protein